MENKLSANLQRRFSNSSMDWEHDQYNVDKIIDFPLYFISNIKHPFNRQILKILNGRQLWW